jgi:dienelactone hydrolase
MPDAPFQLARGSRQGQRGESPAPVDRRRRALAVGALVFVLAVAVAFAVLASGGSAGRRRGSVPVQPRRRGSAPKAATVRPSSFAVGLRELRLVDASRTIRLPDGTSEPRVLVTYVRYPATGPPGRTDLRDAPAARSAGPFPLVVFGHGFAVTPALYARLLQSWARAGYVVAAPVFPLENENAPGGPDESDLVNQPADMSFVIGQLLAAGNAAGRGPLAGLVDSRRVAVAGQSDGGDTALAVAYDPRFRDRRVGAAVILSGAEIPAEGSFAFPAGGPPLLATQGTADTVNLPSETDAFFEAASPPKYLLSLQGAEHLPPYSRQGPQLAIVERVTVAFLNAYLEKKSAALRELQAAGDVAGAATLLAQP